MAWAFTILDLVHHYVLEAIEEKNVSRASGVEKTLFER